MFFAGVTKMCSNRGVHLCNAILVTEIILLYVIDIQQLITLLQNNIFEQNLVVFLAIY